MGESLFSKQAVQPYLNKEFPLFKEAHEDRLFKHVTFFEDDPEVKLRLVAVDHNYIRHGEQTSNLKVIPTNILIADPKVEKFRVKAVLSKEIHGITESHWVTEKRLDGDFAQTHNQYRARGVSTKNWKSDWVYSELRDFDNDLIVYNMIYDVLDLMLTVHDDQIDYLMDYIVSDTFAQIIRESGVDFATSIDPEEFKLTNIQEMIQALSSKQDTNPREQISARLGEQFLVLADQMKKEFKESVTSSPKEFAQLFRMYKLVDQFQEKQTDFLHLLVEIFLEDKLEKIVKNTNIEVLLQNDEEMGIYLNSSYEFDIKAELIGAIYDASPDDHFVTSLNDAVQLISEPVFFEQLVYSQDEEVAKFLRMVLTELYVPMLAVDRHLVEIETELEDRHEQQLTSEVVEFSIIEDDYEVRHMLVADVIEAVIKGDLDPVDDYHTELIDHILQFMNDSRKTLLIDYNLDEVIEVLLGVGESFRLAYVKEFGQVQEQTTVTSIDRVEHHSSHTLRSMKEAYFTALQDSYSILDTAKIASIRESQDVGLVDTVLNEYKSFKKAVNETLASVLDDKLVHRLGHEESTLSEAFSALQLDKAILEGLNTLLIFNDATTLNMRDSVGSINTMAELEWQESIRADKEDTYFNLFKHYLRHPNKFPILDRKLVELRHELRDFFQLDGRERVQYALGNMDDGWPLGVFRLGINTLKGEVSNS
jgi:hypothetical protein